jgi:hypothetical protein
MHGPAYQGAALNEQYRYERNRIWFALATGLNLAIVVCYLTCKPPQPHTQTHTLSWQARLFTSAVYLLVACLIGALGTWVTLPQSLRRHFRPLALYGIRGWVFVPAIVLFTQYGSIWAPLIAVAPALMAAHLDRFVDAILKPAPEVPRSQQYLQRTLFTSEVRLAPTSWLPFGLSLLLYGVLLSVIRREIELLTLFLAACTFLFARQIIAAQTKNEDPDKEVDRRRPWSYSFIAAAFCFLFLALSVSPHVWQDPLLAWKRPSSSPPPQKKQPTPQERSSSGYRAIVLWPIQKKEKVVPSPPATNASSRGTAKPWVIPFYGPYWYFKSFGETPGPNARTTRGDPLKVNVHSTDKGPLLMEAHQYLPDPVDMTCCREMQIVFRNDASLGAFAVSISLADSHSKGTPTQSLGVKFVSPSPTLAGQPTLNPSPIEETLTFPFPIHAAIKKFDAITVVLLPDANQRTAGRKVAVERFVMLPH